MQKELKIKTLGLTKTNKLFNLFLAILRPCQDLLRKLPKVVNIRNACIVFLLTFGTRFSTFLNYLIWQIK